LFYKNTNKINQKTIKHAYKNPTTQTIKETQTKYVTACVQMVQ